MTILLAKIVTTKGNPAQTLGLLYPKGAFGVGFEGSDKLNSESVQAWSNPKALLILKRPLNH